MGQSDDQADADLLKRLSAAIYDGGDGERKFVAAVAELFRQAFDAPRTGQLKTRERFGDTVKREFEQLSEVGR